MSSLRDAFNALLSLQKRTMELRRLGTPDSVQTITATPTNYSRYLSGPSETVMEGREFIIPRDVLKAPFTKVKRNDRLVDVDLGAMTIREVTEIYDLGGAIMGYTVRTD